MTLTQHGDTYPYCEDAETSFMYITLVMVSYKSDHQKIGDQTGSQGKPIYTTLDPPEVLFDCTFNVLE